MQSTSCYPSTPCDLSPSRSRVERDERDEFTATRFSWRDLGRRLLGLSEGAELTDRLLDDIGLNRADLAALER